MSHARMVALLCWPFELSPLNELYRGKLVCSIPYTLGDILMIFGIHVYQVMTVCHVHEWLLWNLAGLLTHLL